MEVAEKRRSGMYVRVRKKTTSRFLEDIFTRAVRSKKATDIKKALAMTIEKGFHPNILAYKAYTDTVPKPCDPNER